MLTAPERADGVGMWGREMLSWSDSGIARSDAAVALTELVLLEGLGTDDRVLLVGPHDPRLLSSLASRTAGVDVLLRSWPDAAAAVALDLGDHVDVHCGSWDRFEAGTAQWDAVLVPDGLERLHGPEATVGTWDDVLARLCSLVSADGYLVVGVANPLASRLLWSVEAAASRADDHWPLPSGTSTAPTSAEQVTSWSEGSGRRTRVLSLFPHLHHPTVAVDGEVLAEPDDPRLVRALAEAFVGDLQQPFRHRDPRSAVRLVLRQRLGEALAPGWFVRLGASLETGRPRLYQREVDAGSWFGASIVSEVEGAHWSRRVAGDGGELTAGPVRRDLERLEGSVPATPSLEDRLLEACAAHDLVAIRRVLRAWAGWLVAHAGEREWVSPWAPGDAERCAVVAGRFAFARLDNVRADEPDLSPEVMDGSWDLGWDLPVETVVVASLMRFADRLVSSGAEHPFPSGESPWGLARSLAAMAGRVVGDREVERASALSVVVDAPRPPWREGADQDDASRAVSDSLSPYGRADFHGLLELREALSASSTALQEAREQVEWLLRRVVVENRRRKAMTIRAREAERNLAWWYRVSRRMHRSPLARGVEAWRESRGSRSARWVPPTNDAFTAEVEEVRGEMDEDRRDSVDRDA